MPTDTVVSPGSVVGGLIDLPLAPFQMCPIEESEFLEVRVLICEIQIS